MIVARINLFNMVDSSNKERKSIYHTKKMIFMQWHSHFFTIAERKNMTYNMNTVMIASGRRRQGSNAPNVDIPASYTLFFLFFLGILDSVSVHELSDFASDCEAKILFFTKM